MEKPLELRIVHVGIPAKARKRFGVARDHGQLPLRHRGEIAPALLLIEPLELRHLLRVQRPDIGNVAIGGAADLDAVRVDQHQPGKEAIVLGGHFECDPAAEREPDRRHLAETQFLDQIEIDIADVVGRLDPVGPLRHPEAGRRGNDQLVVLGEVGQDGRAELQRFLAIEHEQRRAATAPLDLELQAVDAQAARRPLAECTGRKARAAERRGRAARSRAPGRRRASGSSPSRRVHWSSSYWNPQPPFCKRQIPVTPDLPGRSARHGSPSAANADCYRMIQERHHLSHR